jgi:uncharacterized delta-60 repeat protein
MKTKQTRSAFSNLYILTGLVAIGTLLVVFAGYAAERTRTNDASRQRVPAVPPPDGSVTEAWVKRIDGPAHGSDHGHDVRIDSAGNVIVTGWMETATGNEDCHTVKYSPQGDLIWENTYAGSANGTDYGYALTLDSSGNVYVAGFGNGDNPATFDIFVLKYDADGNSVWTQRWTSPITNYSAYAYSIAVDNQGNVFTTGFESDGFTDGEFITLKFNSSGVLQWATPYNGSPTQIDYANHILVDEAGNSYITGWSGGANNLHDMTTIKYDPDGNELWVKRYNGTADDNDYAYRLALDASGNVYVAGQSVETGSDNDITTIKYAPNGDEIWVRHYDGPAHGYDAGQAIAVDADGDAYITGNHTTATGLECVTLKYSAAGDLLWTTSFNGPDASGGVFISIALDDAASAYVTGFVFSGGAGDSATVKYDTNGIEQWAQLYDGPGHSSDGAYTLAVDNNHNVAIAGYSTGTGTDYDYTTIKYSESAKPTPTPTVTPSVTPTATPTPTVTPSITPTPSPTSTVTPSVTPTPTPTPTATPSLTPTPSPTPTATPAPRPTPSPRPRPTPRPRP